MIFWPDIVIFTIVGLSALMGFVRGLTQELLSILSWVFSFWLSIYLFDAVVTKATSYITLPVIKEIFSFLLVFIPTLVVAGLLTKLISGAIKGSPISGIDRGVGLAFGIIRGSVIVLVVLFLGSFIVLPETEIWHQSMTLSFFQKLLYLTLDFFSEVFQVNRVI
tara:strand:- start:296 stop:787 length:492 start_codon:yes stop_codon:yes gene_type:complete